MPQDIWDIPLLPIECFKNYEIKSYPFEAESIFLSSGTSDTIRSKHLVDSIPFYHKVSTAHFNQAFGSPENFCHLALLPSYLQQGHSSLISMVDHFIELSNYSQSNFYLHDYGALLSQLLTCRDQAIPTVLWGVSYALLDFLQQCHLDFPSLLILETGGMKGRKKEMVRAELHQIFSTRTNARISSEYGMTELLSQAYLNQQKTFDKPSGMWAIPIEINDPLSHEAFGRTARIGFIDTANIHSCAFILTQDLGRVHKDGSFEVVGRMDYSDLRGCNLLITDWL